MNHKKKVILLLPDGVGIKNYLYTKTFSHPDLDLMLWHNLDDKTLTTIKSFNPIQKDYKCPTYKESLKEKFVRELICLARLKHNAKLEKNPTILTNWNKKHKTWSKKIFYTYIELASKFVRNYQTIIKLDQYYQFILRKNAYFDLISNQLKLEQPDLVFCTHQRAINVASIFSAANSLSIQTATVIYSWDNLPKARLALRANHYLVWSNYMKDEMANYYPEIPHDQVVVSGTPQFECYFNADNIMAKQDFYSKFNLDINKKIICYSGDDELTSPDDPKYLEDLILVLKKYQLDDKYQVLLRRCPVDISGRFDDLLVKYSGILKEATPVWQYEPGQSWVTVCPLPEDVKLLVSTAYYCDVVVNVGSTMAFDFAMFKKPCIYINYDQTDKKVSDWSVKTIYKFQHFRSMPSKDAVLWWNSPDLFLNLLNQEPNWEEMNLWKNNILGDIKHASQNITSFILN